MKTTLEYQYRVEQAQIGPDNRLKETDDLTEFHQELLEDLKAQRYHINERSITIEIDDLDPKKLAIMLCEDYQPDGATYWSVCKFEKYQDPVRKINDSWVRSLSYYLTAVKIDCDLWNKRL
jgi:hypothetical protein